MFRKLAATIAVSTALVSTQVWSLGLGNIETESALNQPLKAEINLLSSKGFDEDDLNVRIASFESYNKFGVIRQPEHNSMRFEVFTRGDGSKAIRVFSSQAIKEPFLNFLVELNWPQGKLLREYTLLLDPPTFNKTTSAVVEPGTSPARRSPTTTQREVADSSTSSRPVARTTPTFDGNSWTVGRGQTLWSIASQVRPSGASVQQTLAALYRNNPQAFINNDINRLRAGAVLNVPATSEIASTSASAAVYDMLAAGSTPRSNDAPLDVRQTVNETSTESSSSSGGRLTIASVDESSLNSSGGTGVDSENPEAMQTEIDSLREAVETLKLQNQQLKEQLVETDGASETGVAIEDDTLAVLSGGAETVDGEINEITDSELNSDTTFGTDELASDDNASLSETSANVVSENNQVAETKPEPAKPVAVPMQSREKAFYEADGFWWYVGGGILGLLALLGAVVFVRNRQDEDISDGLVPSFGDAKAQPRKETSLDKQTIRGDEQEADPVGEADILIARGRLNSAEVVLEKALANDPMNDQIRVKLMEVYASQQKLEQFNQLKAGLPDGFDHDSELGLKLASLVSLVAPLESEQKGYMSSDEFNLPSEDEIFGNNEPVPEVDLSAELEKAEEVVEKIDTNVSAASETVESAANVNNEPLDFDVDLSAFEKSLEAETEKTSYEGVDFSLNDDEEQVSEDTSDALDLSDEIDNDVGLSDDEAATKLDLARAYIEMGDEEAARDILLEVQKEGNGQQSDEASKLLNNL